MPTFHTLLSAIVLIKNKGVPTISVSAAGAGVLPPTKCRFTYIAAYYSAIYLLWPTFVLPLSTSQKKGCRLK